MKKAFGFSIAATMVIGGAASADVIYDNPAGSGNAVNQEFGDFPTYSTYLLADMSIPDLGGSGGSKLNLITAFFTTGNGNWGGITQARINIFADNGGLPAVGDDPTAGALVSISYDAGTGFVTTIGLDIDLAAGNYWIGITPLGDFGIKGQEFQVGGQNVNGQVDAYRNPGGSFAFPAGTGWGHTTDWATLVDLNMHVEGVAIPAPGALALLGIAGLVTGRRRRR